LSQQTEKSHEHDHEYDHSDRYLIWAYRLALANITGNIDAYNDDTGAEIQAAAGCLGDAPGDSGWIHLIRSVRSCGAACDS
jgi:hypothetical protein